MLFCYSWRKSHVTFKAELDVFTSSLLIIFLFISVVSNSKANQNQMNNNNQAPKPPPKKSVSMRDESMPEVGRDV